VVDYNDAAWYALFLEDSDFAFIDQWRLGRELDSGTPGQIHTLVCVFGAAGRYEEAWAAYAKLLANSGSLGRDALYLAHAFLALSFGAQDRALQSFQKAMEAGDPGMGGSSAALAQVWLARLGSKRP
jgi:tetratricopeptide (TPR) repeat protein